MIQKQHINRWFALIVTLLMVLIPLWAQTPLQKGFVKTRGRMVNGQHVKGEGLYGATVSLKGRKNKVLVQKQDGQFSFPALEQTFIVEGVQKSDYQLVDVDMVGKPYRYSSNPFYLLMENPRRQMEDKTTMQRRLRDTLYEQLKQKEREIDAMKDKMTDMEYQLAMQKLYDVQEENERLIHDMAEQFVKMDFDVMDELHRHISECILSGRLTEADSLLRSKGSVEARVQDIRQHDAANEKEEAEIVARQAQLENSKALARKKKEDLAQDLMHWHNIYRLRHQLDSAAYYIELRARLDTTCLAWLSDAGTFLFEYLDDKPRARRYYLQFLRQAISQYGEENEWVIVGYNNVASTYQEHDTISHQHAQEYYEKAIAVCGKIHEREGLVEARIYNNWGQQEINWSGDPFDYPFFRLGEAVNIIKAQNLVTHEDSVTAISIYSNIGSFCYEKGDYGSASGLYEEALEMCKEALGEEHPLTATLYNNYGNVLNEKNSVGIVDDLLQMVNIGFNEGFLERETAVTCHLKALKIRQNLYGEEHPLVVASYNNVGASYYEQEGYQQAKAYFQKALSLCEEKPYLGKYSPSIYYYNMAWVSYEEGKYAEAIDLFRRSKEYGTSLCDAAAMNMAGLYNLCTEHQKAMETFPKNRENRREQTFLGNLYEQVGDIENAIIWHDKAYGSYKMALYDVPPLCAEAPPFFMVETTYTTIQEETIEEDCVNSTGYFLKLVEKRELEYGPNHIETIMAYQSLADSYFGDEENFSNYQRHREKTLELYHRVLELKKKNLGKKHPSLAVTYLCLANLYRIIGKEYEREVSSQRALDILKPKSRATHEVYAHLQSMLQEKGEDGRVYRTLLPKELPF